jgi:hypothetical protein
MDVDVVVRVCGPGVPGVAGVRVHARACPGVIDVV